MTLGGSPSGIVTAPGVVLTPGSLTTLCVVVSFDPSAGNEMQGRSTVATFLFDAVQVAP